MSNEAETNNNHQEQEQEVQQNEQISSVEEKAIARGWRPQEEWEGDPDAWVDAKEFLFRGELMDTIHNKSQNEKKLAQELDQLKGSVTEIREHYSKLAKAEVDKRIKELRQSRREAVRMDDLEAADQIEEELEEIKSEKQKIEDQESKEQQNQEQQPAPIPPEVKSWLNDNSWADENSSDFQPDLAQEALAMLQVEISRTGDRSTKSLDNVKSKMAKLYPDRFPKERGRVTSTSVDSSTSGRATTVKGRYASKMSDDQRKIGQKFVDLGTHKNLEEYAKELHDMGEI